MSKRKYFTPEQKVATVRRHLLEGVPVSDLCDELGIPRDHWLEDWEKRAIVDFCRKHPREGYRRLT